MIIPAHLDHSENTIRPGWEERYARLSVDDFRVTFEYDESKFSDDENKRNKIKFQVIAEFAQELMYASGKGSLKYVTDERTPEEWRAFGDDEERDLTNYRLLERAARRGLAGISKAEPNPPLLEKPEPLITNSDEPT